MKSCHDEDTNIVEIGVDEVEEVFTIWKSIYCRCNFT